MSEIRELAKIRSTFLGREDHGILTAMLHVDYGDGGAQGIGGYAFDEPLNDDEGRFLGRRGTDYGMEWVARCLRACGVDSWEKLPGRTIYVLFREGSGGARIGNTGRDIVGIENLPTEPGERFLFDALLEEVGV